MALEQSATYLDSLVQTNPDGSTDLLSTVDNHLRLTKGAIKRTFPNLAAPVTATQGELNSLVGQSWNELVAFLSQVFSDNYAPIQDARRWGCPDLRSESQHYGVLCDRHAVLRFGQRQRGC